MIYFLNDDIKNSNNKLISWNKNGRTPAPEQSFQIKDMI